MMERPFSCRGINEVVLRVNNMQTMIDYYVDVIGLKLLRKFEEEVAFLQIGGEMFGTVQTLTLFSRSKASNFQSEPFSEVDFERTSLHHFAINIKSNQYENTLAHFEEREISFSKAVHTWVGWRSIFLKDPDGNTLELVCYDRSIHRGTEYDYSKLYGDPLGEH